MLLKPPVLFILSFLLSSLCLARETDDDNTTILALCAKHIDNGSLVTGRSGTAYACYHEVLGEEPNNAAALAGLKKIEQIYAKWAWEALKDKHKINSYKFISRLALVNRHSILLADLQKAYQDTFPNTDLPSDILPNPPLYDKINGDVGDLKIQINHLKQQFFDIEAALDKKVITDTQALALTEVQQRFERLQQEFYSIRDPNQMFYAVIITLWQQLKHTEKKLIEAQAKIKKNGDIDATLSEQARKLTTQLQSQTETLQQIQQENQDLKQKYQQIKQKNMQFKQKSEQSELKEKSLNIAMRELRYKYYKSQSSLHKKKKQLEEANHKISQLQKTLEIAELNIAKTCHKNRLKVCNNASSCVGAGGIWELNECLKQSNCRHDNPSGCRTQALCKGIQAEWFKNKGCRRPQPCNAKMLLQCTNIDSCVKAGGRWHNKCLPSELLRFE